MVGGSNLNILTCEQYKDRLSNIDYAEKNVIRCLRRVRIHDYIPGQVVYNLGEYPSKFSICPTEYDYELIKSLAEMGVGMIQLHEEWNDAIRIMGADKFSSHDPKGLKEFIDLCHHFNIKIIPYISSGFFDERDPDFREDFTRGRYCLNSSYYRYRMCFAGSPKWNEYIMTKLKILLDTYEFDGIYNDLGYDGDDILRQKTGVVSLDKQEYDPYLEDLLVRIYSLVKEQRGICKIHQNCSFCPKTKDKVYDYLWVGEAVESTEELLKAAEYDPYVIVAPDYSFMSEEKADKLFAQTLPFLQFLIRYDGRPIDGFERISVPGVDYIKKGERSFFEKVGAYNQCHPEGPYVYSEWSSIPDNPLHRKKWSEYLKLYKPMVSENSICFVDIKESAITKNNTPVDVHMSLFVNEEKYICISNTGSTKKSIIFNEMWSDCHTGEVLHDITLLPNDIRFLKYAKINH